MARKKSRPGLYPLPLLLLAAPFILPPMLLHLLCILAVHAFNALEGILESQHRDRYGPWGNTGNKATELPQEVQLRVFHLLRTRAKLGETVRGMDSLNWSEFSARKDLAAARLVCLAWHEAATEVLYTDVDLNQRKTCIAFANTLVVHPQLARRVRRVAFPRSGRGRELSQRSIYDGYPKDPLPALALKLAVEQVVHLCDRVEEFRFFQHAKELRDVAGLLQCAPRVVHLSLRSGGIWDAERMPAFVPGTLAAPFPRLTQLTLLGQTLDPLLLVPLRKLHTLRLSECAFDLPAFHALLARLPQLRNVVWRGNPIDELHSVEELLGPRCASLELSELTLISPRWQRKELTLHGLHHFNALRDLTISARMLASLQVPPPALVHLTVTFAPLYSWQAFGEKDGWQMDILGVAEQLVHRAAGWREMWSPGLSSIALWDVVGRNQLVYWSVVSYIIRETLVPRGFDVSVNIILCSLEELDTRDWLHREENRCPLRKLATGADRHVRLVDYRRRGELF